MSKSWYINIVPKIKDVKASIDLLAKKLISLPHAKSVYAWGSFVKENSNNKFPIKDLDIIVCTDIPSDDLLSIIDEKPSSPFNLSKIAMENEGYNPNAVKFTKSYIAIKDFNLDHWTISSDKKLLHWGATCSEKREWDDIKKDAEEYAEKMSNILKSKLQKSSTKQNLTWVDHYRQYIEKIFVKNPSGWYASDAKISDIIKETMRLL
jgi:hypothetical protein